MRPRCARRWRWCSSTRTTCARWRRRSARSSRRPLGPDVRRRLLAFAQTLRAHGVEISVSETIDALAAVAAAGVARETLREALAATLVKDERDRATFDRLFEVA